MSNLYKNTAFWSWNGKIEEKEALAQIKGLKENGYGGAFIHARGGLITEYLGKRWFNVFDACINWAKDNDFDIWLYDEFGWPSGFGGGKVNGLGAKYQLKHLVASEKPENDEKLSLLKEYNVNGKRIYVYIHTDPNYVDLLNPEVTREFIKSTHEVYYARYKKYFGNVIKGIFTDEPQVFVFHPYSEYIVTAFKDKFGIDFIKDAWKLFSDVPERKGFFYKYYSVIAELFTENFVRPISEWCDERGILFTGHFPEEDGLMRQYRATGGVMRNYQLMSQPGIDFLGRRLASPVLLKQLCSVKNQFDKKTVISETFGCCGWNVSFSQLLWIWGYQAAFGINKACLHLSAYTIKGIRKRDYPAFFSYQEPWWGEFSALSEEMERINTFISQGKNKNDILLLSALSSTYFEQYRSERGRAVSAEFRKTVEGLLNKQYPFDIGDERILRDFGEVSDSAIKIEKGVYRYVIVPETDNLEKETWDLLRKFSDRGGNIAFINKKPSLCSGSPIKETDNLSGTVIANRAGLLEKYFRSIGYKRKVKIVSESDDKVLDDIILNVTEEDGIIRVFAQNISCGKFIKGALKIAENGQFYSADTNKKLNTVMGENGVYTEISIPPAGNISVKLVIGETPYSLAEKFVSAISLEPFSAKLTQNNSFNIDKAYFVIDGKKSKIFDTAIIQDEINRTLKDFSGKTKPVNVVYEFTQADILTELNIAAETEGVTDVFFNGVSVKNRFKGWFIDKSIRVADCSDIQKTGQSEIILTYFVKGQASYVEAAKGFETARNIFHYDSEAESVYLTGNFSVSCEGVLFDDGYLTLKNGNFVIRKPQKPDFNKELTAQGLLFYRGNAEYFYSVVKCKRENVYIRFEDFYGVTAKIFANGKSKTVLNPLALTDITDLLNEGENTLKIILFGSNRNLLGPFHHISGEPALVGNNTFRGTKGFEDTVLYNHFGEKTCDGKYRFVKFGIGNVIIEKYTETIC